MKKLADIGSQSLSWIQPKLSKREFELRVDDEPVATLRWESTFGSMVSIQTSSEKWLVRRSGFFWRRVTMHHEGGRSDDASFKFGWFGHGVFHCPGGGIYLWARSRFWPPEWAFTSTSDFPVVRFRPARMSFKSKGEIELTENATLHRTDLPLLILAGWYLVLVLQRRRRS